MTRYSTSRSACRASPPPMVGVARAAPLSSQQPNCCFPASGRNPVPDPTRCCFVALIGAPNVGKSTLLNRLVGAKVSIVSPKVQTTRRRVLGILLQGSAQLIFVDTPGIFAPRRRLDRAMVRSAWQGAEDADLVVLIIDASRPRLEDE